MNSRREHSIKASSIVGRKPMSTNDMLMICGGILIALLLLYTLYKNYEPFTSLVDSSFSYIGSPRVDTSEIEKLNIIFFMSPTCPWCKKMKDVLQKEGTLKAFKQIDITTPEGRDIATKFGAVDKGVPNFVSTTLGTGTVGFKESTGALLNSLMSARNQGPPTEGAPVEGVPDVQSLGIIMFKSEGCSWCNKAKTELAEAGVSDYIEKVDVNEGGQEIIKNLGLEFKGVPMFYSKATGKSVIGYKPVNDLIASLA
jgi:glutaredoxin